VDGNVFSKNDARGVVATYGYDALNRLTGKAFSDGTAPVGYYFDGKLPVIASTSPGTGSVTISGSERSFLSDCPNPPCQTIYDTGTVSVTVGSVTKTVNYQHGSTSSTIATALRSAINTDSNSPATAGGTGATITLTSKASGAITNYSLSASAATTDENDFPPPPAASFTATPSGPSLTGGSTGCNASGINLTPAYAIGRRTGMCDAGGSEAWSFDTMGREVTEQRTTNGQTKSTSYTYNPDGSMATLTYPSGRTITYTPNAASQPVSAVDGTNGINYVTAAAYAPQGALSSLTLGYTGSFGGIQINDTYTPRLQPNELKAWSTAGVAMDLVYGFVDSNGKNNGNVVQVTNNKDNTRSQQFSYDQLNRILTAKTTATSGSNCWSYNFGIDVWANLNSAQPIAGYTCTQANLSLSINTNNRITNTGVSYDASGNMLGDGLNTYGWDAESQIKAAAGVNYTYDGDGNRLQKSNGKIYWYGAGSQVLDESDANGNITDEYVFFGGKRFAHRVVSSGAIYYYAEDLLGSSRVITTATGSVCYEADFLPFGGEHVITNTCPQNYKFTGKERDTETGNDDFGARYYSSSLGRWLSPDWSAIPAPVPYATLTNPQSLNLYGYVGNNPETFADINGHLWPIGTQDPSIQPFNQLGFGAGISGAVEVTGYGSLTQNQLDAILLAIQAGTNQATPQPAQNQAQQGTPSQPAPTQQTLSAVKVDKNEDYLSVKIDWKLSSPSKNGGWVVQHVIADWNKNSDHPGHYDYWEAWFISPGKTETNSHNKIGFDDKFSGGFGTKIHAEARFYEGLKLPGAFKLNGVQPAGGLRSVSNANAPQLSTSHATAPVIRDWNP
jgi:RHS repeat-associated protein